MFQNLTHRTRRAAADRSTIGLDGAGVNAVNSCSVDGDTDAKKPVPTPWDIRDSLKAMPKSQGEGGRSTLAGQAMPPTSVPPTVPSTVPSSLPSCLPSTLPSSLPSSPQPRHIPSSRDATRENTQNPVTAQPRHQRRTRFIKMDMSDVAPGFSPSRDDDMETVCDSDVGVNGSVEGSTISEAMNEDEAINDWVDEDTLKLEPSSKAHRARLSGAQLAALATRNAMSGRARRDGMKKYNLHTPQRSRHGPDAGPSRAATGSPHMNRFYRPSTASALRSARGTQRISRHKAYETSAASSALQNMVRMNRGSSKFTLSNPPPYDISVIMRDAPDDLVLEDAALAKEAVWTALQSLPGFNFPPLEVFLSHHNPWAAATMQNMDTMEPDNVVARIQNINALLPLDRRVPAVQRLAVVLACPKIQKICGRSVERARLPNFLDNCLEEQSRLYAEEESYIVRRMGGATPTRSTDTLELVLARRFRLKYVNALAYFSLDMNAESSAMTDVAPTFVDGKLVALVLTDMMPILAYARRAFDTTEAAGKANGKELLTPGDPDTRTQKRVLTSFSKLADYIDRLNRLKAEQQNGKAAAEDEADMEIDLLAGLKI